MLKIDKSYILESTIFYIVFLQMAIINYLGVSKYGNWIIVVLVMIWIIKRIQHLKRTEKMFIIFLFSFYIIAFIDAIMGISFDMSIFRRNMFSVFYPLVVAGFFVCLSVNNREWLIKKMKSSFYLFNIYYIINIIIIIIQIMIPFFAPGITNSDWVNDYREDLISGIFGYSGTHQLCFFSCFIVIYNFAYGKLYCKKRLKKYLVNCYTLSLIGFIIVASSYNDNKGQYIFLVITLLIYGWIIYRKKSNIEKLKKGLLLSVLILFFILILGVIIEKIPLAAGVYDNSIQKLADTISNINKSNGRMVAGGAERFYLVSYAFKYYDGFTSGYGLGSFWWLTENALGFPHFGLADLGTFLILGGLFFVVPCYFIYFYLYSHIVGVSKRRKNNSVKLLILFFLISANFYSVPMKNTTVQITLIYNFLVLGIVYIFFEDKEIRSGGEVQ